MHACIAQVQSCDAEVTDTITLYVLIGKNTQTKADSQQLTYANNSSIFSMDTVVNTQSSIWTVNQGGLSTSTLHIIQKNSTRSWSIGSLADSTGSYMKNLYCRLQMQTHTHHRICTHVCIHAFINAMILYYNISGMFHT